MGQTDYLVKLKGDTLKGEVRILSYDIQDRIQVTSDGKKQSFLATQVNHVSINGEIYKAQKQMNNIRMMKLIKEGYLSLYGFKIENQATYDGRLLTKKDGTTIEVPNLTFKKSLATYLEDCNDVSEQIRAGAYTRNEIEKVVDDYNACMLNKKNPQELATVVTEPKSSLQQKKTEALTSFSEKVASINFAAQADALELLKDIQGKVDRNEAIPNYQAEALKSILSSQDSLQIDLQNLLALLKEK